MTTVSPNEIEIRYLSGTSDWVGCTPDEPVWVFCRKVSSNKNLAFSECNHTLLDRIVANGQILNSHHNRNRKMGDVLGETRQLFVTRLQPSSTIPNYFVNTTDAPPLTLSKICRVCNETLCRALNGNRHSAFFRLENFFRLINSSSEESEEDVACWMSLLYKSKDKDLFLILSLLQEWSGSFCAFNVSPEEANNLFKIILEIFEVDAGLIYQLQHLQEWANAFYTLASTQEEFNHLLDTLKDSPQANQGMIRLLRCCAKTRLPTEQEVAERVKLELGGLPELERDDCEMEEASSESVPGSPKKLEGQVAAMNLEDGNGIEGSESGDWEFIDPSEIS